MELHPKKRLEVIVEAPALARILRFLDERGVKGYTILPAIAGSGASGRIWSREGQVGDAGRMVAIVAIMDEARLEQLFDDLYGIVSRQIGIVSISDCMVVRKDAF
ncbi:DUF190 domain-containing protein [Limibaculum sp. M0105]|uniref:Nitrogen regulatory protein P-II n=1 Tax=Thermohalobaculum xanthum TaxID=2753746 RepID=A0A8J7SG53_9RHOB|nr:DUF190 domain-containing protein [Thermohalobaculum xanthum]MBK0400606.1 DUF190 domain-containing protein [Thermohalobaculum xanthum]